MELKRLSFAYPNSPKLDDELVILADLWVEDLGHLPEQDFLEAIRRHRKQSRFFPTPSELLEHYRWIVEERARNRLALPEPPTEPISLDEMRVIKEANMKRQVPLPKLKDVPGRKASRTLKVDPDRVAMLQTQGQRLQEEVNDGEREDSGKAAGSN